MKKISNLFLATLLVSFILPSVTLASWWNPFTWTIDSSKPDYQSLASTSQSTVITTNAKPDIKSEPIKPTVITKTITVQDPSLQNQIDLLLSENNSLKNKLADLQSAYLICTSTLSNTISTQKNQTSAENDAKTLAIKQLKIKTAELQEIRTEVVNFGSNLGYGMTPDQNEMHTIEGRLQSFQTFDGSNMFPADFWTKLSHYTQAWKQALTAVIDIEVARMNVEVQKAN